MGFMRESFRRNLSVNRHERQHAGKRGGHCIIVSLDEQDAEGRYLEEPVAAAQPETLFDRRWRLALLDAAFARLKQEYTGDKKEKLFEHLKPFLAREVTPGDYDPGGAALGSVAVVSRAVRRLIIVNC